MINLKINNIDISVKEGSTILEACKEEKINIPTLCHMKMLDGETENCKGSCRVCIVKVKNRNRMIPACCELAKEGMEVITNSKEVIEARKTIVELLLSNHPKDCLSCEKNLSCELRKLAGELGINRAIYEGEKNNFEIDCSSNILVRDMNKCILCRRCVTACNDMEGVNVLATINRGFETEIGSFFHKPLKKTNCTYCGQCVAVCPTAALTEAMDYRKISEIGKDKEKIIIAEIAPAVRVALGEEFNVDSSVITTGKIVAALKLLGFNKVFDTNFSADLTIMEEGQEFMDRLNKGENLPLITSCCPAWIKFAETNYRDEMKYISSCKSPQQIFGAIVKSYLAEKYRVNKENIVVVSIMPCIAKKYEAKREEFCGDVDIVITTRELGKLIRENSIDIANLKEEDFDEPLGVATGAGMIFGSSGGVMEGALRTVYEWITKEELKEIEFQEVRGLKGVKESTIKIGNRGIRVAVVSSLKNADKIMKDIKEGKNKYDFIEIMACPGGCIDGGGQPYIKGNKHKLEKRMERVYEEDKKYLIRKSHENPVVKKIYNEFLNEENIPRLLHVKR